MRMAKKLLIIIIAISILATVFASGASATDMLAYGAATVNTSNLNLRSGPGMSFSVITTLNEGDIVVILERTNSEWYYINFHGVEGYVSTTYLRDVLTAENFSAIGIITGDHVNIRTRPDQSSDKLATYPEDTNMTVIGINSGWYKVVHDGYTGYVRSDYMTIISGTRASSQSSSASTGSSALSSTFPSTSSYSTPPANLTLGQQIVEYALSYLGSPYVYGGVSPSGFDCSGFVTYVYKNFGISVTRDAHGQYRDNGVIVEKADLAPGDLVFFSSNGGGYISHVGIYIGDDEFVHSSSHSTGVIVSRLDSAYYISVWYGAKRLI